MFGERPVLEAAPLRQPKGTDGVRDTVMIIGSIMIVLIWAFPLWNAAQLLSDSNYVFWMGRYMPLTIICGTVFLLLLWFMTVLFFFKFSQMQDRTEQTVLMIGCIFVTLLGLVLVLTSLIFMGRVEEMRDNLWNHCGMTSDTISLSAHYEALKKLRETPDCLNRLSVKECVGYVSTIPFTGFLESAEKEFKCSGFCLPGSDTTLLQPAVPPERALPRIAPAPALPVYPGAAPATATRQAASNTAPVAAAPPSSPTPFVTVGTAAPTVRSDTAPAGQGYDETDEDFVHDDQEVSSTALFLRARHRDQITPVALTEMGDTLAQVPGPPTVAYPPTLFSKANYRTSCQGMMARNLKFTAVEIGTRTFVQGVFLILIAIGVGFLMLIGFCVNTKPQEFQGLHGNPQITEGGSYGAPQDRQYNPGAVAVRM